MPSRADDAGPDDNMPEPGPVSEKIQAILEATDIDDSIIEKVIKMVDQLEYQANADCPRCVAEGERLMIEDREPIAESDYRYYHPRENKELS